MSNDNSLVFHFKDIKGVWRSGVSGDPNDGYLTIYRLENGEWVELDDEYSTGDISYWEVRKFEAHELFDQVITMYCA